MRKKLLKISALVAVGFGVWLAADTHYIKKGMPPGYHLECDSKGHYRPCDSAHGKPLYWTRGFGTKAQAIRRAWRQYYYVPEPDPKDTENWTPCQ